MTNKTPAKKRPRITGRYSLSIDAFGGHIFADDFFAVFPEFQDLQPLADECRAVREAELAKKNCRCRINSRWMQPFVDKVLDGFIAAKTQNHDLVRRFIRLVAAREADENVDSLAVYVIYNDNYDIFVDPFEE